MNGTTARIAELKKLRRTDPAALIALYRQVARLGPVARLPPNLTLQDMIRVIAETKPRTKL